MSDSNFLSKILLLLSKTRDSLIDDLKKEFVSVRTALDDNADTSGAFSLSSEFSKKVNIIDAVFAKVGYDISHYEQLSQLKQQVLAMLTTVDDLTADVKQLSAAYQNDNDLDGDEVAEFLDASVPHIQTLLSLVKSVADIEWDRVAADLQAAGTDMGESIKEQFVSKAFARKILDHILITLLKNAKDVFHDEIEYIRLAVVNGANQLKDTAEELAQSIVSEISKDMNNAQQEITNQVNTLLKETFSEFTDIRKRIGDQMDSLTAFIKDAGDDIVSSNIYVKISRAMSITYSILDFLGVVREVKVTLRLPDQFQDLIGKAEALVSKADGELGKAINNLSTKIMNLTDEATSGVESLQGDVIDTLQDASTMVANSTAHIVGQMDESLQVTKEVTGLSMAAVGAVQTQLLTLYGPDGAVEQLGSGINGVLNGLSDKLTGVMDHAHKEIGDACKSINAKLETVKNISYPVTIVTVSWSSVEQLFTHPVSHFRSLYPINNVDDIESLMRRVMGIMHCLNPDIPDFDSLRNMLESLLKRLQQKVITLINEAKRKGEALAKEIWEKFSPIIATLRKVVDMLKEMALALKERMYGVLNDLKGEMSEVMNGAKQLVAELQEQIKTQAGVIIDEAGRLVDKAGNVISNAENKLEGQLNKVFNDIDSLNEQLVAEAAKGMGEMATVIEEGGSALQGGINEAQTAQEVLSDAVKEWLEAQRKSLAKINIPHILNKTLAEPLIDCASGILKDTFKLDKAPDFASVFDLLRDIASLNTMVARQLVLQPAAVNGNTQPLQLKLAFSDVIDGTQGALKDAWNKVKALNINDIDFNIDVKNIVVPQLQAWAYGVTASMKTVMDPKVWKNRMDNLITQLQAEFQNDLQNVTSLISKEGANRLIADAGAVKDQLKDNLQINDYVTIVQTAMNDVVLPNPELYFSSLKVTLSNIVAQLASALLEQYKSLKSQLEGKLDVIKNAVEGFVQQLKALKDDAIRNLLEQKAKVLGWADEIKQKVVDEALRRFQKVKEAVTSIVERIMDLVERVKSFFTEALNGISSENISNHLTELKESLKNRLEDLALEIWNHLKSEVIMPVVRAVKDEIMRRIRSLVKKAMQQLTDALTKVGEVEGELAQALNKVPGIKELKEAINALATRVEAKIRNDNTLRKALKDIEGFDVNNPKISDLKQLPAIFEQIEKTQGDLANSLMETFTLELQWSATRFTIQSDYICWAQNLIQNAINFVQSDMGASDILALVVAVYKGIPKKVKQDIAALMPELPELPDNGLTRTMKKATCNYDLDNKFCNLTLLNLETKENQGATATEASLLVQVFAFVGTYDADGEETDKEVQVTVSGDDDDTAVEEEDNGKPALYIMFFMKGNLMFTIATENHEFGLHLEGSAGESFGGNEGGKPTEQKPTERSLGFCLTKKTDDDPHYFHSWASTDSLSGLMELVFQRKSKDGQPNPAKLLSTKYLDLNVGNYPQVAYLMFNSAYPEWVKENFKLEKADGFTFGYMAKLEDMEIVLKLRQNEFFESVLKDDISAKFSLALLYDYQKGLDFGGDYSFHIDLDCSNLKIGKLNLQGLGIDIGSLKNDWGTLQLGVGSTFSINLDAVAFSFENLGVALNLNIVKPDFSLGDWKFGCKFNFPTGIGISIDTTGVKGSGLISYTEATGELIGALELRIINKFGVSAFMLVDLGTVKGHQFSFVGLISTEFSPGIPLGMGFSLTGVGGCLGLERMIDRKAITTAVRQGTLASIFFVKDIQNHLAEMKSTALAIFPAKKNQFFVGLLGQISYEPVLKCDFGLMLQLPNPTEVMIVGALRVAISDTDVIRINVHFAGGINFEEGIWFDASIVDSEIVGIKLEGDMAFRLFWGGTTKGFLLSIGGFHPNYTPEPGMLVDNMKRLAMKMDYGILKLGLETYLAITSNSFQIGAHLDLRIGWKKFGIFGYAGFDALFQFDPFMFMFDVECGVSVKCGSWTLMSIDLAFSLSGPRPWHVSGKAKFKFLFIPIKVSFSLEWGDKQPELPNKQIELKTLFDEQILNNNNWIISETAQTDDDVVVSMEHGEKELLVQPFETIHFNQSVVPLQLEKQEARAMDLCNNAVPTDYTDLTVKGFTLSGSKIEKDSDADNLSNDFAPGLYYKLSNQEKLRMPSYKKYVSGFSLSATEGCSKGKQQQQTPETKYYMKKKGAEAPEETNVTATTTASIPTPTSTPTSTPTPNPTPTPRTRSIVPTPTPTPTPTPKDNRFDGLSHKDSLGLLIGSLKYRGGTLLAASVDGVKQHKLRRASYPLKTRRAFDRYVKTLDSIIENN